MSEIKQDIVKSNALIEAVYNPGSVYQMRLLMAALLQVKAKEKIDYKTRYYISANALADMTGSAAKNNYKELRKAAKDLMETTVHIKDDVYGNPLERTLRINLVSSCEYGDGEGQVGLRFTEEIIPYVSDLKKRFTQYQAKYVMPMRSSYGIRLYELCLQWLGDEREFSVEEFKVMFGLENKYARLDKLKEKVIKPALDDINKHSDIRVSFGQRKAGRKVTHFQFRITRSAKASKALKLENWMNEYNVGHGEVKPSKNTLAKYEEYKKDPDAWVSREVNNG